MIQSTKSRSKAPVDRVERWPLEKLVAYARNPRLHSAEQIDQIAASMQEFGQAQLIVVDEKGEIIAGHGRVLAAEQLGWKHVAVGIARGWSETKKKGYRIADNKIALNSVWDDLLLGSELKQIAAGGLDLPLLGFDDAELSRLTVESSGEVAAQTIDREMSAAEKVLMASAWRVMVKEWVAIMRSHRDRGYVSSSFTKGVLAVNFLRAKFFGDAIPSACTLAYTPHRVDVAGHVGSIIDGLDIVLKEEKAIERLWFVTGGKPRFDALVTGTLPFLSMRLPGEFPAQLARDLYDEHVKRSGMVLDPCHGWGGRMLGFLLSKSASRYIGFDTDPESVAGVQKMYDDLLPYAPGKKVELNCTPFEDAVIEDRSVDFALTSPPYFSTEKYGGEQSSWRRYKTLEQWVAGFYKPLLSKTARALKSDGIFALQIGSQRYKLESIAKEIANGCGFEHLETRATEMQSLDREHPEDGEVIMMLRKSDTKTARKKAPVVVDAAAKYGRVL